jgi:hypothetical protein
VLARARSSVWCCVPQCVSWGVVIEQGDVVGSEVSLAVWGGVLWECRVGWGIVDSGDGCCG